MSERALPPQRTPQVWRAPGGLWGYDVWGHNGRPVVLIPAVLFDRTMWWPVAADLREHATVLAVDLPGHGASTRRSRYDPYELIDDLASLVYGLDGRQAPVVIGHASSAPLADLFATQYAAHAVVVVDPLIEAQPPANPRKYVDDLCLDAVPACYREMVTPGTDPRLLTAYIGCMYPGPLIGDGHTAASSVRLAVHSQIPPSPNVADPWRHLVYDVPGRFAHLTAVRRFARDVCALL